MNETYYNIVFRGERGDIWTYQDKFGRDINLYSQERVDEIIKEHFQDPKIIEASVFKIKKTIINSIKNLNQE